LGLFVASWRVDEGDEPAPQLLPDLGGFGVVEGVCA
jgi:hypothetical protein